MFGWLKKHFTPLIRWREPADYVVFHNLEESKSLNWKQRMGVVIMMPLLFLPIWWLNHFNPKKTPPPFWMACLGTMGLGFFLAYVGPWINNLFPREATLRHRSLFLGQGSMTRFIALKEIQEVAFKRVDNHVFAQVFRKHSHKRVMAMQICMPDAATVETFAKHLTELGVKIKQDTPTARDTRG